jgi:hypothetical protein
MTRLRPSGGYRDTCSFQTGRRNVLYKRAAMCHANVPVITPPAYTNHRATNQ